jgi:hypothetical protein
MQNQSLALVPFQAVVILLVLGIVSWVLLQRLSRRRDASCCDRRGESCYSDPAFGRAPCLGRIPGFASCVNLSTFMRFRVERLGSRVQGSLIVLFFQRLCGCSISIWLQDGCDVKAPVSMVNYSCMSAFA